MSLQPKTVLEAVEEWVSTLPGNAVRLRQLEIPEDDEYGLDLLCRLEPFNESSCPLEISVAFREERSIVRLDLDVWSHIAKRLGCRVSAGKAQLIGLYIEPLPMTVGQLLDACKAVAAGSVRLNAGVMLGKLTCTGGKLETVAGPLRMHGPEAYLFPFVRAMAAIHLASVCAVVYEPWASVDA